MAGWRGEREREGGRGRGVSEFVFFFLLLRARGGTPFLFLPRWFPSLGPHLSRPLHGAHGVRRAGRGGGVPARGGGGGECRGRERTPACAAAQHSTRTRGSLFFFRGGTGREGEGPGGCATHTRRCGRACACGGERDKERKKQASGSRPRPRSLPPALLVLAHKQVFFPTHPPPFSAPHTPPWVTSRSSSPPRTTPGTRCVRMGCWAAGAGGARGGGGGREVVNRPGGDGRRRGAAPQGAGPPPTPAARDLPACPVVMGVPGCLPGASRPPKPSGPPRPTAFCGARQGRRRGHALATPPLSQPRTAARGHWSSRRCPGRDRTWDSVPAFWQWDGVLLAGGRRPPVAKHAARLRSQEEGGPPPAAPVACFFQLPALTHHHPTAPHSLSQVKYRRRREGKTDYRARLRLTTQDKNK